MGRWVQTLCGHILRHHEQQDGPQETWGQKKRSLCKKPKGKQDIWKDVPTETRPQTGRHRQHVATRRGAIAKVAGKPGHLIYERPTQ